MLRWLWQFVRPYKLRLTIAIVALVMTAGLTLGLGQGVRLMVDNGFAAQSTEGLADALSMFGVLVVLVSIGAYFRFFMISWLGERVVADIRKQLYQHLVSLPPSFFEENLAGEIQSRVTTDTTLLQTVIGSSFSFALRNALTFMGGITLMFISNLKLSLIVLIAVPLIVFPMIYFGRKVKKLSRDSQDKIASVGAWAGESLQHIKVVQAFTREDIVTQQFGDAAEGAFDVALRRIRQRAFLIMLVMMLVMGSVAGMLYIGGSDVIAGKLSGGELAAFVFYAIMVAGSLAAVTEVYGEVQRAAGAAERIRELLATEAEIQSPEQNEPAAEPAPAANASDSLLSFQQVGYHYPSRPDRQAIADLTLDIKPGERIALVGPSGAGKSTLFDLLLRFRDPQQGDILLHGKKIKDWNLQELRSQFALVPQQPVLFSANVGDNLRYGKPDATEAEILAAAKAAHADEFIEQLPEQYQSFLGEQGVKLSGGQKQRLAIARAILRDPEILLLDEATSALDAQSEHLVQQALDELMKDRTTFIIAHRLATVAHVDRIAVFDHGKLVAIGSHQELLNNSPLYKRLAELQFNSESQTKAC
ncbi:ABC transporter transmembrane domain-containing protein [Bacterioplanoides sp. SCSIO 12839]|uniref:ABC transporter transmembrane domain-containing protein n=1 Tax=Bacterioplanoides sp. SCSIO 12839 TaxID=2829569 RepID=UPI0021071091|nr:ABC transporter transmembrane domain-containing protein [Bacterioplanoides sp. SCSIO 12839]UTW48225.1 ATP-binding cassette domain-containing protein [Bacterioplanoides sp. SCSIO 12839]